MKRYLIIGNAESVHLVKWVKELVQYFEVYIISSKNTHPGIKALVPEYRILNLDLSISESGGNIKLLFKVFSIKNAIKKIKPHYINPHYITSHGFIGALIKKFTAYRFILIQSAWGSDILVTPFKSKVYYRITRFCLRQADLATSDSETMTSELKKIHTVKTLTFVFGLDKLPDMSYDEKETGLCFSNRALSDNYNINSIIDFFYRLRENDNRFRLFISNDGPMRKQLEEKVRVDGQSENITFTGFLSQKEQNEIYRKAQFYISIPDSDSTSVSLIDM
jgi:glycosyltransferase involved in cell wall biosynthesis